MHTIHLLTVLIPALPLVATIVTAIFGARALRGYSHLPIALALIVGFLCSLSLVFRIAEEQQRPEHATGQGFAQTVTLWRWVSVDQAYAQLPSPPVTDGGMRDFAIDVTLRSDALTAMMLAMVTFVSLLVVIFSVGYMRGDPGYWRFFTYVSLFVFSMTMLVSVSNFVLLFVFWEAVGVCSYLLIGFWYEKPSAAAAGMKAFLVNRVGDFGFALAVFLIWITYGTLNYHDTQSAVAGGADGAVAETETLPGVLGQSRLATGGFVGGTVGLSICLLLLLGACGKSAQFPLHVWLPDAMEGPTPVSALIHAATMVTAGVYLIARCTPLFMVAPEAQLAVAMVGGFTALLAGLIALTQHDLKRVLAYSTISQLGYMFLALGTGSLAGIAAGMFHLFTHAFFKALLFLGAGSVMHAMGNVIDMRRFGGLRKLMPITHHTCLIGCLALAGIPPLAGFWSKDAIVAAVHDRLHEIDRQLEHRAAADPSAAHENLALPAADHIAVSAGLSPAQLTRHQFIFKVLYWSALVTAFLTAFYTFRAFYLTFYGPLRVPREAGSHAHESPGVMWGPLAALAFCAALAGVMFDWTWASDGPHRFADFIAGAPSLADSVLGATTRPDFHARIAGISTLIALAGWGLAAFCYLGSQVEIEAWGRWMSRLGLYQLSERKFFFDEFYRGLIVLPLRGIAAISYVVDRWIVDGLVNVVGRIPLMLGSALRPMQMGLVQFYALAMVLGVLILIVTRFLAPGV